MIKLENAVMVEKIMTVESRPALYASKCSSCGKIFRMLEWCNERCRGVIDGTFDEGAVDPETGKGMGNIFTVEVCSFACAHEIFTGGWRRIQEYKPFADADIALARAELTITFKVDDEAAIRAKWNAGLK